MKVPLIKQSIKEFKKYLSTPISESQIYKWECQQKFSHTWDLSDLDLYDMYNQSFSSTISNRLWVGDQYVPKKIMLEFIKQDKEFVRTMFRDLYNEEKDLMMRISRFIYHCDMLLAELKNKDKRNNAHYHDNYKMISVYLAFQYPEKYTIYDYAPYANFMKKVGANSIPLENDLPKFFTLTRSLYTNFLIKDDELIALYEKRLLSYNLDVSMNLLIAHDFYTSQSNLNQ